LRKDSGEDLTHKPSCCACSPTAKAISTAARRSSVSGGNNGAARFARAGECLARARAAAKNMPSVTRRARVADTASPMAGKMNTLLHCEMRILRPLCTTSGKGEPVAISARPSVQRSKSSGTASDFEVGLESGKIIGRLQPDEDGRVNLVNHLAEAHPMGFARVGEIPEALGGLGISALLLGQIRPPGIEQASAVDEPEAQARFLFG
jgi:hypothetical protein